ncbi:MAG: 30S ribosomal protein S20 [Chloroflexi bacterium]|nr:30S ribosomal protein S20 [Chloroflexota bacterium]MBI3338750.1 30S ribosomal protein S20 [Chloroflexota bacterium]
MANIKSQIKRNRQNEKRRLRNRIFRGNARTAVKEARTSLKSGQETPASVYAAISALDKAAQRGAIHPRNAARRKGRLMKQLILPGNVPESAPVVEKKEAAKPKVAPKVASETKPAKEKAEKKPTEKKTAAKKPAAKKTAAK